MSAPELPQRIDHDAPVFVISVAAQLAGMHPQTLRTYDRMGLGSPRRTPKRGRRYSARDIARLRLIQRRLKTAPSADMNCGPGRDCIARDESQEQ